MSFQTKLDSVLLVIENHNSVVGGKDQSGYVDFEAFSKKLKILGATTEEILKSLSYEEILDCLPVFEGVKPKILAKEIAKVFRGKENLENVVCPMSPRQVDRLTLNELISHYDFNNPSSHINKKLLIESNGQPFLVFKSDGTVWIEKSALLLNEIKKGYPPRNLFVSGSDVFRIFKVNEVPENYVNENPIYPGRALRLDETCDQTNRSWEGVPLETRQLAHIICLNKGKLISLEEANYLIDICVSSDSFKLLSQRYVSDALIFKEKKSINQLPILKIKLDNKQNNFLNSTTNTPVWHSGKPIEFNKKK